MNRIGLTSIWIHRVEHIVGHTFDERINLQPVVESTVLIFVELSNFLVLNSFQLTIFVSGTVTKKHNCCLHFIFCLSEFLQMIIFYAFPQCFLELPSPAVFKRKIRNVLEAVLLWLRGLAILQVIQVLGMVLVFRR